MSFRPDPSRGASGDDSPLGRWVQSFRQLFDGHPAHVALLGLDGTVLAVNSAWRAFGAASGLRSGYEFVGQNYLALCEAGVAAGDAGAQEAYIGLLDVMRNGRPKFTLVYPCHSPVRRQWFRMWVEPQTPSVPTVIVAHKLIDARPWHADDPADLAARVARPVAGTLQSGPNFPQ